MRRIQLMVVALLVLFLLPYLVVLFKDVQSKPVYIIDYQFSTSNNYSQEESQPSSFNVSWISTWNATPTELSNNSIATGDHVVLNITCNLLPNVNVTGITLNASGAHVIALKSVPDSHLLFDTYIFEINITTNLLVSASTNTSQTLSCRYENVTFNNFFAPTVTVISPNGGEDWTDLPGRYNITWTASDANNDMLLFDVSFSEFGYTWRVIESGTQDDFGFANGLYYAEFENEIAELSEGLIKVTVFDNDTEYAGGPRPLNPTENLPSLWPGLSTSDRSDDHFYYGYSDYNNPDEVAQLSKPADITLYEGELGRVIEWVVSASYYTIEYTISRNGTVISSGTLGIGSHNVSVSLDGLSAGVYEYEISATAFWKSTDKVIVTVLKIDVVFPFAVFGLSVMAVTVTLLVWRRKSLSSK